MLIFNVNMWQGDIQIKGCVFVCAVESNVNKINIYVCINMDTLYISWSQKWGLLKLLLSVKKTSQQLEEKFYRADIYAFAVNVC